MRRDSRPYIHFVIGHDRGLESMLCGTRLIPGQTTNGYLCPGCEMKLHKLMTQLGLERRPGMPDTVNVLDFIAMKEERWATW